MAPDRAYGLRIRRADDEETTGAEDPSHLGQRARHVLHVLEHSRCDGGVVAFGRKRQRFDGSVPEPVRGFGQPCSSQGHHLAGDVDPGDDPAASLELEEQMAGPHAAVEHTAGRIASEDSQHDRHTDPQRVSAGILTIVGGVVASRLAVPEALGIGRGGSHAPKRSEGRSRLTARSGRWYVRAAWCQGARRRGGVAGHEYMPSRDLHADREHAPREARLPTLGADPRPPTSRAPRPFYVTTAIDYANGVPHLGHALEKIQADCVARYHRLGGERVHFVTGLDEHGQTVAQTARSAGATPRAWVDAIAAEYREVMAALAISCDDFIRTSEPRHARAVQEVFRRICRLHPGDVYESVHSGFYCGGCESFKLPDDLVDGQCAEHPTIDVEWVDERSHFFRLSAYARPLQAHYQAHPDFVVPPSRLDEMRSLVAEDLPDFAISRSRLPWGIPFPGAPGHTFHVWFDALVNYLSATGFPEQGYELLWPADVQVVGPDITRFHAVVWPAMLMAAGLELPRRIWVHGWLRTDGARFSKTAGVRVPLDEAVARHGSDALRYYLLVAMPWDGDGEFSWERFDSVYEEALAGDLGSLVSRSVETIVRHGGGRIPPATAESELDRSQRRLLERYRSAMDALQLRAGALQLGLLGRAATRYLDEREGRSASAKSKAAELDETVGAVHRSLVRIAALAQPFMPGKGEELYRLLGGSGSVTGLSWDEIALPATAGWQVASGDPLFPDGSAS
mgnify:CR=1 FL=1